jgi:hypothetical protein
MVHHVLAEIALLAVGARVGVVVLNVAILAAGTVFGGADRDIVGAAIRIVVDTGIDHRRLPPLETAREKRCGEQESDQRAGGVAPHIVDSIVSRFVIAGHDPPPASIEKKAFLKR